MTSHPNLAGITSNSALTEHPPHHRPGLRGPIDPTSESRAAFVRRVDRRTLTFEPAPGSPGVALIRDGETGSLWQVLTGQAVEGELFGERLERLPSHYSFWFAWSDFHPRTELYGDATA